MKLITRHELRTLLLSQTSATIVSIIGVTTPDMKAKNAEGDRNPFMAGLKLADGFTIGKVNKIQGRIGTDYNNEVENQLTKEIEAERMAENLPPFSKEELEAEIANRFRKGESWHRPIMAKNGKPTVLSVNKKDNGDDGSAYLRYVPSAKGEADYLRLENGSTVDADRIIPFLPPPSKYANQGTEKPRVFLTYALESIIEIRINKEHYRISDNLTDLSMPMRNRVWEIAEEYFNGERKMSVV